MWYRGVSQEEFEYVSKSHLPIASRTPLYKDAEVVKELKLDKEFLAGEEDALDGVRVINVWSSEEKAKERGDWLIWFDEGLVRKYSDEFGVVLLQNIDFGLIESNWGLIEI